jgi:hypothetical protein
LSYQFWRGCRCDDMVVGFTTTFVFSAYYHCSCEFESRSGEVYSIQQYMIKVCQWLAAGLWFLRVLRFPPPDRHDIAEILLKVALSTITLTHIYLDLYPYYTTTEKCWITIRL